MKKSLLLLALFFVIQAEIQADEPKPETIEIVIKIDKDPEPSGTSDPAWQAVVDSAVAVAQQCQECTERTVDIIVNNVCECIKGMVNTMKTDPSTKGCISVTIKDSESGVAGSVRKK